MTYGVFSWSWLRYIMVKELFPDCCPVSQLANIWADETCKMIIRRNILINRLFAGRSTYLVAYPHVSRVYPQN
jgi:hypothetical protein